MDNLGKAIYANEKAKEDQFRNMAPLAHVSSPLTMEEIETRAKEREAKRVYDKKIADDQQYAADLKQWKNIQQGIRSSQFSVHDAQTALDNRIRSLQSSQAQAQKMLDDGFVLRPEPVVEQPKVTPAPAFKPAPVVEEEEAPKQRKEVECPNGCGTQIPEGIAYHVIGEYLLCVLDERRTRLSGQPKERIEEALNRQAANKENN